MSDFTKIPLHVPEAFHGFHPHDSSPADLERAGYPPHPDSKLAPLEHVLWESIAKRNPKYIPVVATEIEPNVGLYEAKNWSGGVLPIRPQVYDPSGTRVLTKQDPFNRVVGSWVVPNPHPQKTAEGRIKDGDYEVYTWVGLDGWEDTDALKVGIVSGLKARDGRIIDRYTYAAILFRGRSNNTIRVIKLVNFVVEPGDLVTGYVYGHPGSNIGNAWIVNQGRNEWAAGQITAAHGVTLQGKSAEWITAGQGPLEPQRHPFPNYGATVFFEGFAGQQSGQIQGIERALLSNAVDLDSSAERGHNILTRTSLSIPVSI
ncbi:hypothetical protein TWF281_003623 [Arthrobotrys megalospora]